MLCFLSTVSTHAQELGLIATVETDAEMMVTDKLRNVYLVSNRQEVRKFDQFGKEQFTFSEKRLGAIKSIDAYNPLKVLVYYEDYNVVVALDNTLSEIARYNLNGLGFFSVPATCLAYDNNLWFYDAQTLKLKKVDEKLNVIAESDDFSGIIKNEISPAFMMERDNRLYLSNPETGILVFDIYGTYERLISLKNVSKFQIINDQLIYFNAGELVSFQLKTLQSSTIGLPVTSVKNLKAIQLQQGRMFILDEADLRIYEYE